MLTFYMFLSLAMFAFVAWVMARFRSGALPDWRRPAALGFGAFSLTAIVVGITYNLATGENWDGARPPNTVPSEVEVHDICPGQYQALWYRDGLEFAKAMKAHCRGDISVRLDECAGPLPPGHARVRDCREREGGCGVGTGGKADWNHDGKTITSADIWLADPFEMKELAYNRTDVYNHEGLHADGAGVSADFKETEHARGATNVLAEKAGRNWRWLDCCPGGDAPEGACD